MLLCTLKSNTVVSGTTGWLFNNTTKTPNALLDIHHQFKMTLEFFHGKRSFFFSQV